MESFFHHDFMLGSNSSKNLFHDVAKELPIFDFHNHIDPKGLSENNLCPDITALWLGGDHYKWRAMRCAGIDEDRITGKASSDDKFMAWAQTVEQLVGSPLYDWTHLELQRFFGIDEPLNQKTAMSVYKRCNELLGRDEMRPNALLRNSKVTHLCTTDDCTDSLEWHKKLKAADPGFSVLPTFRVDSVLQIEKGELWRDAVQKLLGQSAESAPGWEDFTSALDRSLDRFVDACCVLTDVSLEDFDYVRGQTRKAQSAFRSALNGESLDFSEITAFKSELLRFLGAGYCKRGLTMQLHMGAMRNVNGTMLRSLGPNTGYDCIGSGVRIRALAEYLDDLNSAHTLGKTILYCLEPSDTTALAVLCGAFGNNITMGSAWWFSDTERGIRNHIRILMDQGLLAQSPGMVTDSRSILSFVRHEYFRRILCDEIGALVEAGRFSDLEKAGELVRGICYENALKQMITR